MDEEKWDIPNDEGENWDAACGTSSHQIYHGIVIKYSIMSHPEHYWDDENTVVKVTRNPNLPPVRPLTNITAQHIIEFFKPVIPPTNGISARLENYIKRRGDKK